MKSPAYHHLHFVFACLQTHSNLVEHLLERSHTIEHYFFLTQQDKNRLNHFLQSTGQQLYIAAKIMEKKRLREMLVCLPYSTLVLETEIPLYWHNYLQQLPLNAAIPATPISESIYFLEYVLAQNHLSPIHCEIAHYELIKNRLLSYEFPKAATYISSTPIADNMRQQYIQPNPSLIIRGFAYPISTVLSQLKNLTKSSQLHPVSTTKEGEIILFVKCRSTGLVKSMSINFYTEKLLQHLLSSQNLSSWLDFYKTQHTTDYCLKFLNDLLQHDVVTLVA